MAFASGKGQKMSFRPGQGAWGEVRKVSGYGNWEVGDPFSFRELNMGIIHIRQECDTCI